jgi:hypothetical protein
MLRYVLIRIFLWFLGAGVSIYPTLFAVGTGALTWPPSRSAMIINGSGQFRDLLFVIVTISVLEISLVIDSLVVNRKEMSDIYFATVIVLLILNIVVLASGMTGFSLLPPEGLIPFEWVPVVIKLVGTGAGIGLLTEIVISTGNHYLG